MGRFATPSRRVLLLLALLAVVCVYAYLHFTRARVAPAAPAPATLPARGTTPEPRQFVEVVDGQPIRILAHQPYARSADVDPYDHTLDLYLPERGEDRPMLVFVHGGGWTGGDKYFPDQGRYFASKGMVVASVNYRLASVTRPPNACSDLAAALAYLRDAAPKLRANPDHIVLMGHSAGAHLAALAVCDERYFAEYVGLAEAIRGVILLDGSAYHVPDMMRSWRGPIYIDAFGLDSSLWQDVSPYHYARNRAGLPPFIMVYADDDRIRRRAANELAGAVGRGGGSAQILSAPHEDHISLQMNLAEPGNPTTPRLIEFIFRPALPSEDPPQR